MGLRCAARSAPLAGCSTSHRHQSPARIPSFRRCHRARARPSSLWGRGLAVVRSGRAARRVRVSSSCARGVVHVAALNVWNPLGLDVGDPVATAVSLGVAAAGGAAFQSMGVPLPWILGSMFACTAASLSGVRLSMPGSLRLAMQAVVGVLLGSTFTPAFFHNVVRFAPSVAGLVVFTVTAACVGQRVLQRAGFAPSTAFFSAAPGGLNDMVIMGGEMGADDRVVAVSHSVRLLLVVSVLPFIFKACTGAVSSAAARSALPLWGKVAPADAFVLIACGLVGPRVAHMLRLPAPQLVGPMLCSAAAHLAAVTSATPPLALVFAAQTVIGGAIGCRFGGVTPATLLTVATSALCSTLVTLALAAGFAVALAAVTGVPWPLLLLAYSPGGITEMTLLSLSLGYDAAFVATHHVIRISCLVLCVPWLFRLSATSRI